MSKFNLLNSLPDATTSEVTEAVLTGQGVRLERIVSLGQSSPEGVWYDQVDPEWVMVLRGKARLAIDGEYHERELGPSDAIFLEAHCRHRVTWTTPDQPTIWLALFVDHRLAPRPLELCGRPIRW